MESVILEEKIDPNYELTEEEYFEYIESLGIFLPEDNDLLYIAHEALKAELPKEWKPCQTTDGQVYYFNFVTGESVWDHPIDSFYREKVKLAKDSRFSDIKIPENQSENLNEKKIKDEFSSFCEKIKNEYESKMQEEQVLIQKSLEAKKKKLIGQVKDKEDEILKANKLKIEKLRKNLEKEEELKIRELQNKLKNELDAKIEQVWGRFQVELEDEKKKVEKNWSARGKQKKEEESFIEIKQLREQIERYKEKCEIEVQVGKRLRDFHQEKLEKAKVKLMKTLDEEKKMVKIEGGDEEFEDQLTKEDQQTLANLQKSLEVRLKEIKIESKQEFCKSLQKIKESIEEKQKKNEILKRELEEKTFQELISVEDSLKSSLETSKSSYRAQKIQELQSSLGNHRKILEKDLKTKEASHKFSLATKTRLENSIQSTQNDLNSLKTLLSSKLNELDSLLAEEKLLKADLLQFSPQNPKKIPDSKFDSKNQSPSFQITSPELLNIETDLESIKKSISIKHSNLDSETIFAEILKEKKEVKALKKSLESDKEKWNKEKKSFKANPNKQKFEELKKIKKILDCKINWHNWRVKEIKVLEKILTEKSSESELQLEIWRGKNTRVDTEVYSAFPEPDVSKSTMINLLTRHTEFLTSHQSLLQV